jgi:hypothetical protein
MINMVENMVAVVGFLDLNDLRIAKPATRLATPWPL